MSAPDLIDEVPRLRLRLAVRVVHRDHGEFTCLGRPGESLPSIAAGLRAWFSADQIVSIEPCRVLGQTACHAPDGSAA